MKVSRRIAAYRDEGERERIVLEFLPYIKFTARRLARFLPPGITEDDLLSSGVTGLLQAMERFDPDESKLRTFAEYRIKGAILDELRSACDLPRTARERINAMKSVHGRLERELGRLPDEDEVAREMGISVEEYRGILQESNGWMVLRYEDFGATRTEDGEIHFLDNVADPAGIDPSGAVETRLLVRAVEGVISQLPEKEQLVLSLYYKDELTMKEIGMVLGVSEARVCQIHGQAILRCKSKLEGWKE